MPENAVQAHNGNNIDPYLTLTVDGTHCRINEPLNEEVGLDKRFFSHKHQSAGVSYEIAISTFENKVIWMNGPFPAGKSDLAIFKLGLQAQMAEGTVGIADGGYRNKKCNKLSTPNPCEDKATRKFRARARARHEAFNARLKNFELLDQRFRHRNINKHKMAFEAICVICQYQLENGSPLFDV
jgi:hypothetical protein